MTLLGSYHRDESYDYGKENDRHRLVSEYWLSHGSPGSNLLHRYYPAHTIVSSLLLAWVRSFGQ